MSTKIGPLGESGLAFISKISASISHEIKNSLAVINESAGFLEDISLMAMKGRELDINKLNALAGTMLKQVKRANGIVNNMNRLAHSLDDDRLSIDVNSFLELMLNLSERTAVTKGVKLTPHFSDLPALVTTNPFFLENMIWLIINFAMSVCGSKKSIAMEISKAQPGATISFSGLENLTEDAFNNFLKESGDLVLSAMNATLSAFKEDGRVILSLPEDIAKSE